jgi:ABC-type branched-subunit amino acid transport system permease subunit
MLVLAVLLGLVTIAIDGIVLAKLTLCEGFIKGMFGLLFMPYTFNWGWRHTRSEDLKQTMLMWTAILLALIILILLSVVSTR